MEPSLGTAKKRKTKEATSSLEESVETEMKEKELTLEGVLAPPSYGGGGVRSRQYSTQLGS